MAFTVRIVRKKLLILLYMFWQQCAKVEVNATYGVTGNEISGREMKKRCDDVLEEAKKLIYAHEPAARAEKKYGRRINVEIEHPALYAWVSSLKITLMKQRKRRRRHHG